MPWWITALVWGCILCPISPLRGDGKMLSIPAGGDLLQVPLASLLTHWHELFHPLAKKLGRNNKGCNATRQARATWKSRERASPSQSVNDANIWLWLPLNTPVFRLPSASPESWAGPKHHSTLKPAGKSLTGERDFFLATIEENPKLSQRTVTPNEQSSHFPLKSEMGKQQGWSSRLGPGSPAGYSPCSGYALLNFPTFFGWQQCFWNSIHGNYGLASLPTLGWQLALAGAL